MRIPVLSISTNAPSITSICPYCRKIMETRSLSGMGLRGSQVILLHLNHSGARDSKPHPIDLAGPIPCCTRSINAGASLMVITPSKQTVWIFPLLPSPEKYCGRSDMGCTSSTRAALPNLRYNHAICSASFINGTRQRFIFPLLSRRF